MTKVSFFSKSILTACVSLALALTFSCSSDDGDEDSKINYGDPVTYEGETYKTVIIGTQTWFAKNLNYNASGSKCYGDDLANCTKYGRLYDWDTAKEVCPDGWHLPSNDEWNVLVDFVGGMEVAGTKLKSKSGWNDNGNGEDEFGFAALPGGFIYLDGGLRAISEGGWWWTSTEFQDVGAYGRIMEYYYKSVGYSTDSKSFLYSVRCVKD